jgi:hypothetical protein
MSAPACFFAVPVVCAGEITSAQKAHVCIPKPLLGSAYATSGREPIASQVLRQPIQPGSRCAVKGGTSMMPNGQPRPRRDASPLRSVS